MDYSLLSTECTTVYLGLGANLGDRERNIRTALRLLKSRVEIQEVSSLYETDPVGFEAQPTFLNAVCRCVTTKPPLELLAAVKYVEAKMGRSSNFPDGPRVIDIDILLYGTVVFDSDGLTIPHPRMFERSFVLVPLAEIAPQAWHPVIAKSAKALLDSIDPKGVRRFDKVAAKRGGWTELRMSVAAEFVEPLVELFAKQGKAAVAVQEEGYEIEWGGSPPNARSAVVYGYLPDSALGKRRRSRIETGLLLLGLIADLPPLEERRVDKSEWESVLRGHFSILHAGRRMVVRPAWLDYVPQDNEIVITLDPGIAFGTGHHPTTRLCLGILESIIRPGDRVLDVGTGSGILAVAAGALGAREVIATDTDRQAIQSARRAARMNGLKGQIRSEQGSMPTGTEPFDAIVMNITARVVLLLLPVVPNYLSASGTVVLSGLLYDQREAVEEQAQTAGLTVVERLGDGDWVALVLRHQSKPGD